MERRMRTEGCRRGPGPEEAGTGDMPHAEHVAGQGVEEARVAERRGCWRGRGSRVGPGEGRVEVRLEHSVLKVRRMATLGRVEGPPCRVPG